MPKDFVGIEGNFRQCLIAYSDLEPCLDRGIKEAVRVLMEAGIPTIESCEGGKDHAWGEPTVRFQGGPEMGFLAYAVAIYNGLPVSEIRRCWRVCASELTGPDWEITFYKKIIPR